MNYAYVGGDPTGKDYSFQIDTLNQLLAEGRDALKAHFLRWRDEWKTIPLNVAVIGQSGAGKSSYINAIRDLTPNEEGAAMVGVTQTTVDIKSYPHPTNNMLKFWDLPGVGTSKFPTGDAYLQEVHIDRYDSFLVMTHNRFTENDVWLGKEIKKRGKPFYYVRSKVDNDLRDNKQDRPGSDQNEVPIRIRSEIEEELQKQGIEAPIFLISIRNRYKEKLDFEKLKQRIIADIPEQKKGAMLLSMSATSEKLIRDKVTQLRARANKASLVSALVAAVPVPGFSIACDMAILLEETKHYQKALLLDEESLARRAADVGKAETVQVFVAKMIPAVITTQFIQSAIAEAGTKVAIGTAVEEMTRWLAPVLGAAITAPISAATTRYTLNFILDKMERASIELVNFIARECVDRDSDSD